MTRVFPWMSAICLLLCYVFATLFSTSSFALMAAQDIEVEIKKGELFSLVTPISKAGGEESVKAYYESAFPLAQGYGLQNRGS